MATVSIVDLNNVIVDGVPSGHLIDAVRNKPLAAADLKAAFDVWVIGHLQSVQNATNKAAQDVADAKAQAAADLAAKEAEHAEAVAALTADLEALGTKEEAQEIRKAQEAATLQAEIEERSARLSEIQADMAKAKG